ncbi:MAG TPA: hypothetical protein VHX65_02335 [Pirellulales bacterium]|jgi:hypothetical protein|nr:hypothetical protein [Pirellulales bacterium]
MTHKALSVLLVGDAMRSEFAHVFEWLREHSELAVVSDMAAAAERLAAADWDPELIVVAQSWPGEFSPKQIDRLRRMRPLARLSELLGSWCEGETRTGRPAGGTLRNYWHQWLPRMGPQFERAARGQRPVWSLPTTATDDERLLATVERGELPQRTPASRGLIAVLLSSGVMARAVCDACPTRGYACIWLPHGREKYLAGVRAVIWDAPPVVESWAGSMAQLRQAWKDTPIVALAGFPRIEDVERLRAAGAAAVVSKPFLLDDLFWQIEQL